MLLEHLPVTHPRPRSNTKLQRRPGRCHITTPLCFIFTASPAAPSCKTWCVTESPAGIDLPLHRHESSATQFRMKLSLLLLAIAICLQKVALAVSVVEEAGLTMDGSGTNRRFLTQYLQHEHWTQHPHDLRHLLTKHTDRPSCSIDFQCTSQRADGHKKYKKAGCCNGRCVDLLKDDKNNCGSCGRKCPYGAVCCNGRCTRIYGNDSGNCGGCGKKCGNGVKCLYGICGYNSSGH